MRKIFTIALFSLLGLQLSAQTCSVNSASFDICTSCPFNVSAPVDGVVTFSGVFLINFSTGNADYVFPSTCGPNAIKFGNINFTVSSNNKLILPGDILIDNNTEITLGGNGSAEIEAAGVTYLLNGMAGDDFEALTAKFTECAMNFPSCSTLEQALPVELTRFEAQSKEDMVELVWSTATELNNDYFEIEHSRDGVRFAPVGKVKGEGTTTEAVDYNFMHRQPATGTNYYRLKQVDYDGAFEYSEIVAAEVNHRGGGAQVYPNPTIQKAMIQIAERPERVKFRLSNLVGQQLDLQPAASENGWELDLNDLPEGIYLLHIAYDGRQEVHKIIKK
ncbi:T9SS type A sorting domain-containing protein [Flavilitoribacter nigricans]|uniref:Secretion system C-terminal sorting domain-containing protein n=1 Tax=Flavilitoribacter nigricans (strain ATCC 23147 / DSM 23189 / NBRC 102662 / NCIMB 1420 / SS-2) TaxID=1122177 RepID=A0A2D0NGU0_FLAN2|nr:T9SS type A sorting domain-containing protein [Flavilitoribacter nigricans]PHN07600.1 hypothetical protein CRP01_05730 [Flavilitoribacter nigricans DSM 23189 = NBRC 102662]